MSWSTVIGMDIKEAVGAVMREYLVPELEAIKAGQLRADVEFSAINKRIDGVSKRLDEVIVRHEEHSAVVIKLNELEQDERELKQRFAV